MNKPEDKIYLAFFESKEEKLYFNQLQKITNLSSSSLNNTIKKLKQQKILKEIKTISNTYYKISNKEIKHIEFSKIALNKFNALNYQITFPLKEFIKNINNIKSILLFGSSSRGEEREDSDIDLLIIINKYENKKLQELYEKEIREIIDKAKQNANSLSIHPISIFIINEDSFIKDNNDYLIKSAKNTGYPIFNQQQYYRIIEDGN
ncbi:MAG: nucleotidyltransferase domain-containing protein [Bacteroidales bacterium]|jgi:predicted nucleotidyltransferase/biotin operon repressor|nr:nucleotidyltransferase domain-containing protein [Bacteroidales bacterium]